MVERKAFLANPSINIVSLIVENMIAKQITKRTEIVMGIQVCLISLMNFDYKEIGGKRAFLTNQKHQYHVSQCENKIVMPITKEWSLLWLSKFVSFLEWTFIKRKMVERKAFLANPKHKYRVSYYAEHDCKASNKKNGDCYWYPSLSHFMEELWLQGKW